LDTEIALTEEKTNPANKDAEVNSHVPDAAHADAPPLVLVSPSVPEDKPLRTAPKQKKQEEEPEQSPFSVTVDKVYDGPLDLLLDLIRKQDIDIYDIPIAKITAQFLAYVNQLKASDVDVAGEFIYTASLLIHIKSKMLLPRTESATGDVAEDPRRELVERLLEHERFKNAAQMLQQNRCSKPRPGPTQACANSRATSLPSLRLRRHRGSGARLPRDHGARAQTAHLQRGKTTR